MDAVEDRGPYRPPIPDGTPAPTYPASNPADPAHTYRAMVLLYRSTDVDYIDSDKQPAHLQVTMSDAELAEARHRVDTFAHAVRSWSGGYAAVDPDIIEVDHPVTRISRSDKGKYWMSPQDAAPDIARYDPTGRYDNVIAIWKDNDGVSIVIPPRFLGGTLPGYSAVTTADRDDPTWRDDELLVHEWLHQVEFLADAAGVSVPALHDNGLHSYPAYPGGRHQNWYEDYMRGRIWDAPTGEWIGVTPDAWSRIGAWIDDGHARSGVAALPATRPAA